MKAAALTIILALLLTAGAAAHDGKHRKPKKADKTYLHMREARAFVDRQFNVPLSDELDQPVRLGPCTRINRVRVDCTFEWGEDCASRPVKVRKVTRPHVHMHTGALRYPKGCK